MLKHYSFAYIVCLFFSTISYSQICNDSLKFEGEVHLENVRQLTFGGNNAEAYWSFDNKKLIFQSDWDNINKLGCDQIYMMNVDNTSFSDGSKYRLISSGKGRTTCSYFLPDGGAIFASTHLSSEDCPETKMFDNGRYVWPIYNSYDIFQCDSLGNNLKPIIQSEAYDAEATVSPDGK